MGRELKLRRFLKRFLGNFDNSTYGAVVRTALGETLVFKTFKEGEAKIWSREVANLLWI